MSRNIVQVGGQDGQQYELPKGVSFQTFNWDRTYCVLKDGLGGAFKNGAAVVDSLDIRTVGDDTEEQVAAVTDLLIRNGAKPVAAI